MTEQSTNGPVDAAVIEAETLDQAPAELSAGLGRSPTPAAPEIAPEVTADQLAERLSVIEEAMHKTMKEGVDYGRVPGTDKPTLFKPGAEKLAVLFRLDVQPRNELIWGPGEHLTVISRATVYHAPTGTRLGCGEAICSSRERNRAYRKQERTCPGCEAPAVIKGKEEFGGGWLCWRKKGGCGAKYRDGDERIEGQEVGEIENPDLPDSWNAVDKMASKRCLGGTTALVYATTSGISRGNIHQLERVLKQAGSEPVWLPGADGSWRRVVGMAKVSRDDIVRVTLADGTVMRVTPEHRFPTTRGLVAAGELSEGDVLRRGSISLQSPGRRSGALHEYGWLAGLYLAEGCRSNEGRSMLFSLHAEEEVFVERISAVASSLGARASVRPHCDNGQVVQVSGASFRGLVDQFITGTSCYDKHLSRHAWRQGPSFLHQLLVGYLEGDGHPHTRPGTRQEKWTIGFTGKNAALADDLRAICAMLGYRISLRRTDARAANVRYPTFYGWISFSEPRFNGAVLEKVVSIEAEAKREGSVMYDIEVGGDHLFCLGNGIITHNSRVDAVLSVTGASAIFTQDLGADPTEAAAAAEPEYGPVVSGALKQAATRAAIKVRGGDLEQAKKLWASIQTDLGGYMPEAAARALLLAAGSDSPSDREAHGERADTPSPAGPDAAAEGGAADGAPADPNPHGTRLRAIATTRGVNDAELANLIRNAVAQGPIPADRACNALPTMLARISEENTERTVELLDMFYPAAAAETESARGEVTSVDFGALEPPQAA